MYTLSYNYMVEKTGMSFLLLMANWFYKTMGPYLCCQSALVIPWVQILVGFMCVRGFWRQMPVYTLLVTLLSCSQSWNIVDVYLVLLQCWTVPNIITVLSHILSYYNAELFPILKHCGCIPPFITLLKSSKPWIITDFYTCLVTLLSRSHSRITPDVSPFSLFRWVVSNLIKMLSDILSFYIVQLFTILKNSWRYHVIIHCWKALNLEVLLTYTLS